MADDGLVFVCIQCGNGCTSYEDLTEHMEDHEDQKPDVHQLRRTSERKAKSYGKAKKKNVKAGGKVKEASLD